MEQFYKLYVGSYTVDGRPATMTIVSTVPRCGLMRAIKEISSNLKFGMELYILTPKKEIKAFYRDNLAQYIS